MEGFGLEFIEGQGGWRAGGQTRENSPRSNRKRAFTSPRCGVPGRPLPAAPATLTLDEFPGKPSMALSFATPTPLHRFAYAACRSRCYNPTGQLCRRYVFVHLKRRPNAFGNHSIELRYLPQRGLTGRACSQWQSRVGSGRSARLWHSVEIVSGLQPTDAVIVDPSDSLVAARPSAWATNQQEDPADEVFFAVMRFHRHQHLCAASCAVARGLHRGSQVTSRAHRGLRHDL